MNKIEYKEKRIILELENIKHYMEIYKINIDVKHEIFSRIKIIKKLINEIYNINEQTKNESLK